MTREITWVDSKERMPTKADADPQACVLAWHTYNGVMLVGWHRVLENQFILAWATPPAGPERGQDEGAGKMQDL